jgi:hypothetical protein
MTKYNLKLNLTGKTPVCQVATVEFKPDTDFSKIDVSLVNKITSYKFTPCSSFKGDVNFTLNTTDEQLANYASQYPILLEWAKQFGVVVTLPVKPTDPIVTPKPDVVVVKPVPVVTTPEVKTTPKTETKIEVPATPRANPVTVRSGGEPVGVVILGAFGIVAVSALVLSWLDNQN